MLVLLLCVSLWSLVVPSQGWSATRLGLHVTQEEVTIWQQRAVSGPYKTAGDVSTNSPGDWTRILNNANTMRSNATSQRWSADELPQKGTGGGPGGYPTCIQPCNVCALPGGQRTLGDHPRDAAFAALVLNDTSYIPNVKAYLLYEAGRPKLAFANEQLWCTGMDNGQNSIWDTNDFFDIMNYLLKLVFAYDYIRPFLLPGGAAADASAVATLDQWFLDAGIMAENVVNFQLQGSYAVSRTDQLTNFTISGGVSTAPSVRTYCGGPFSTGFGEKYNNRMETFAGLWAHVGVMLNNTHLKTMAKRWFMEMLQFGVFADGTPVEFYRNTTDGGDIGWRYFAGTAHMLGMIADVLARDGDDSLYTYSTTNGFGSGTTDTRGGPKTLDLVMTQMARYINNTETGAPRYSLDAATNCTSGTLLAGSTGNRDTYFAQTNVYYQNISGDNNVRSLYTRQAAGTPAYPSNPEGGGYNVWGGVSGVLPGVLFMFGNMEGTVNPYGGTSNTPPALSIASPTTYASTSVSGATVTVSGPATDDVGVTQVTWACPQCGTTSGSATCAPACGAATTSTTWTITDLALPANNLSATLTITASDGTLTSEDALTVMRQDIADLTTELQLHFPFPESEGSTTADASGNAHTGTLQTGATFGAGETGNGVVLDGATGQVTVSGTLTSPAVLTLAAWVNLSGGIESGTVLNIANAVGLRIDSPNTSRVPTGFYRVNSSSWPNIVGSTAFPASGWHHVAYTLESTRQVLYLDGTVIAMGSGVAGGPNYATGNTTTSLGRNPIDGLWDLQGTLDDVRVYSRALSEVDVAALVAGETPVAPAIQMTTNSGANYSVTTDTTVLEGTASDSDGTVTSVSLACVPDCGTPTNTGSATAWSFTVPLAYGSQVITVTATDDDLQTNVDTITVTRYCPTDLTQELELWLHLNGDGTDSSGASRTASSVGGVTWGAGVVGSGAVTLNGTTGALSVNSLLDTPATLTLSAWINVSGFPSTTGEIISLGDHMALRITATELKGLTYIGNDTWQNTPVTISLQGSWHHVAFVAMPGVQQLYLDGLPIGSPTPYAASFSYTGLGATTEIGRWAYDSSSGNYLQGSLDEVRVYACPQSATGIQALEDYSEAGGTNLSAPLNLRYVGP